MHEKNREAFVTRFRLAAQIRRVLETPLTRNDSEVLRLSFLNDGQHFDHLFSCKSLNDFFLEQIVVKCCQLIRSIVADDDVRVAFGRAHEYACIIAEQENALEILTSLLTGQLLVLRSLYELCPDLKHVLPPTTAGLGSVPLCG